jgi:RNA polymerase sporulation-specific sigma factor
LDNRGDDSDIQDMYKGLAGFGKETQGLTGYGDRNND